MENFIRIIVLLPFLSSPLMCLPVPVSAQTDSQMRAMMALAGASTEEELDGQEVERYLHFVSHPLEINLAGRSRLLSSGLLTRYQVASLEDYRSRSGDVLSFSELACVDGFGTGFVEAIRPFISLRSRSLPGEPAADTLELSNDALLRAASSGGRRSLAAKYKFTAGETLEAAMAFRTPVSWSFNSVASGKRHPWRVVAGDYNLRFGQGLSLWSGLSLSGFSSSSSFSRRPTGLSPSCSWTGTGTHRGVAGDFQAGRFTVTSFLSFPGLRDVCEGGKAGIGMMPGACLGWFGRNGEASVSAWCREVGGVRDGKVSADFRWNRKGVDWFGESALDLAGKGVAAVLGWSFPFGEGWRASAVLRRYPDGFSQEYTGGVRSWNRTADEAGAAFGLERYAMQVTADLAVKDSDRSRRQAKLFLKLPVQVSGTTVLTLRATERIRPYEDYLKYRTGIRMDLDWNGAGLSARYGEPDGDSWKGRLRLEGLFCRSAACLSYAEAGRKAGRWSAFLRGTVFIVDSWDDRIYSYERDVPGSFNVPAWYGRGFGLSAYGGRKFLFGTKRNKALKLYARASTVRYPFMREPKSAKTEIKLQAMASF